MTDTVKRPRKPQPMQPIVRATDGVTRFQHNKIVRMLVDVLPGGMNAIAMWEVCREDREQLAQLIGYSVSGFGDLSYARKTTVAKADRIATRVGRRRRP